MEHLPDCVKLWNDWDISLNLPKQQQRLRESFADKCKPHYISKRTATATFTGLSSTGRLITATQKKRDAENC